MSYSLIDNVIFLDIETTGISPEKDKIIEIGAVKIKNKMVTRFNTLVNPHRAVPLNIFDLCSGITQEQLNAAPELADVMNELTIFIEDLPIVCHNSDFEQSFLKINNEFLDSLELVAVLFPELTEFNLQHLIKVFLPHYKTEKHRGLSDSEDTIEVLNYAICSFYYESGYTLPLSFTDLEHWSWYKYITNISMSDVKCFLDSSIKEPNKKPLEPYPVFALKDYEKLFEYKKLWRRSGRSYTIRPQQMDASKFIREGLEQGKITIMEAPTGLGKSMAYLLPSVIYTHLKREKIIVSTNTKGLQNQLVEKDIPNLLEVLNLSRDVKCTLIKGKSNYLCFDRFDDIEYPKDMKTLIGYVYLKRLITEKGLGDSEEISYAIKEKFNLNYLIEHCCCDPELCDIDSCKYKERCYYASKVESLKEAQLIVVNHSLLLKWPYQNIVPLENIVMDEAHNLTQEAYDAFESTLVSYEFEKFLKEIYNGNEKNGYLFYLSKRTKKETLSLSDIESGMEQCSNQISNVRDVFENYVVTSGISREYNVKGHLNKSDLNISEILMYLGYLKDNLVNLNVHLDRAVSTLKDISSIQQDKRLKILVEKVEDINKYIRLLEDIITQSKEGYCFYFEVDKHFKWWKLSSIPLDVSGVFYDKVLKGAKSCLFISATLSTDNGYNNFRNTLGINIAKSQNKEIIEVPPIQPVFDYKARSVIYSIEDLDPGNIGTFSKGLKDFILELIHIVEGNIIMLFTSKKRLIAFKEEAQVELNALGVRIVEGKKDIEKLKSRKERYILLGSKGYFEGVDIPGDAMTTVVLDKVPNINSMEPFYKSLIDNYGKSGKDYWEAYAKVNFPIVSIDLKQIYGRLIRTEYDYGSLFIMSKFNKGNTTVKKLEKLLHGVPVVRKDKGELFKDLNLRLMRWKKMNLYRILKEVKSNLKKAVLEKMKSNKILSAREIEILINKFLSLEYSKRHLKYDVDIFLEKELRIAINGKIVNLGKNKGELEKYFIDVTKYEE